MKILFVLLCIAGVALCVVGAMGHIAAFPGAAPVLFPGGPDCHGRAGKKTITPRQPIATAAALWYGRGIPHTPCLHGFVRGGLRAQKGRSMRWMKLFVTILLALPAPLAFADDDPGVPDDYVLAFADEFSQDGPPDPSLWTLEEGPARHNDEQEYYTAENAWVEDGCLVIEARRESREDMDYTSARLNTEEHFSFCYGRLEARIALPQARGTWSALWLLPSDTRYGGWLASGEIDVMEHVGYDPERVHSTLHTEKYNSVNGNAITNSALLEGEPARFTNLCSCGTSRASTAMWTASFSRNIIPSASIWTTRSGGPSRCPFILSSTWPSAAPGAAMKASTRMPFPSAC